MADTKDTLEARRWFRRRLAALAKQYPYLTTPEAQARLADALAQQTEEDTPCPANPPGTPEDAPKEAAT